MFDSFIIGFESILTPMALILMVLGVIAGIIFGAIPGLTGTMAFGIFLPLTFSFSPAQSMAFLMGLYIGSASGGLISATLLNMPGTVSSIATTYDGYPLAQKGEAGKALGVGIVYSFLGGMLSFLVLFLIAPPLASIAVKFGPLEYFGITLFALTLISSVSDGALTKGLTSGLFGIAFGMVGLSQLDGFSRFTFGLSDLNTGIGILPALIGIYAVAEILLAVEDKNSLKITVQKFKIKGFGFSLKEFKSQIPNYFRSSAIGTFIGILPGIGGGTSNLVSYIAAKKRSKQPEKFGTGVIDGVVASETANNASVGGSIVPLLTLGIPGDTVTAILIGAFMIHGIQPGPLLLTNESELVYAIFASLILANIIMILVQFLGIRFFVKILSIPKHILFPVIMTLCLIGVLGAENNLFDVWVLFAFGIFGYVMRKLQFPLTPFILGIILGPIAEINLRRGLQLTEGNLLEFITNPISGIFIVAALVSIVYTGYKQLISIKA